MKRKFSESSEKVEMETKLEDVPDDPEGSDQIRINLLIKEPQIIEVTSKLLFQRVKIEYFSIQDFLYPKPIEHWWSMENLARLSIWISFWATFYFFIDTIYVTGWRTTHPDLDQRSSIFPIIMASIYFSVFFLLISKIIIFCIFLFLGFDHSWIHSNSKFQIEPKRCDFHWCHCHLGIVGNILDCGDDDLSTPYQQPLELKRSVHFTQSNIGLYCFSTAQICLRIKNFKIIKIQFFNR